MTTFLQLPYTPLASNSIPISAAQVGNYLQVTFQRPHPAPADLGYIPQVTSSLSPLGWNSGPGYTSQTVTDNGNGTETVTVTDLAPIQSTKTNFMRIAIQSQ